MNVRNRKGQSVAHDESWAKLRCPKCRGVVVIGFAFAFEIAATCGDCKVSMVCLEYASYGAHSIRNPSTVADEERIAMGEG